MDGLSFVEVAHKLWRETQEITWLPKLMLMQQKYSTTVTSDPHLFILLKFKRYKQASCWSQDLSTHLPLQMICQHYWKAPISKMRIQWVEYTVRVHSQCRVASTGNHNHYYNDYYYHLFLLFVLLVLLTILWNNKW